MKSGIELISEERHHQIEKWGNTLDHDVQHSGEELVKAAITYLHPHDLITALDRALQVSYRREIDNDEAERLEKISFPQTWPFLPHEWHGADDDRLTQLVKAGALIAAEIDRIQNYKPESNPPTQEPGEEYSIAKDIINHGKAYWEVTAESRGRVIQKLMKEIDDLKASKPAPIWPGVEAIEILRKLVWLKDIKDRWEGVIISDDEIETKKEDMRQYKIARPIAWEKARKLLEQIDSQ